MVMGGSTEEQTQASWFTLPRVVTGGLGVAIVVLGFGPRNERALFVLDQPVAAFAAVAPTANPIYPFFYGVPGSHGMHGTRGSVFRPLVLPQPGMTAASALSPANVGAGSLPLPATPLAFNTFGPVVGDNAGTSIPGTDALPPLAGGPGTSVSNPGGGGGGGGTPTPTPGTPTPTPGTPTPTPGTPTPTPGTPTPTPGTPTPTPPAVPEPGTWMMMLAGFGMAGYQLRRRRLRSQLAGERADPA